MGWPLVGCVIEMVCGKGQQIFRMGVGRMGVGRIRRRSSSRRRRRRVSDEGGSSQVYRLDPAD